MTGSTFYPNNETLVEWHIIPRIGPMRTHTSTPSGDFSNNYHANSSFLTVATYRENATREHNGMRIACRLYFKGELKVESEQQHLTVYCMQNI